VKWAQDIEWARLALGIASILAGTLFVLLFWNLVVLALQSPFDVGAFVRVATATALLGFLLFLRVAVFSDSG
jgi:hypothetical protein